MNSGQLHVVFGTGPAGMAVIEELLSHGENVRAVNRSGKAELPGDVEAVSGNATNVDDTRKICQDASVVYNCTNAPYHKWPETLPPIQDGIIEGAAFAGAKLVVLENVYMYGPTHGQPMTEDLPHAATTQKGRTRARMSETLMEAHRKGKVKVVIGRASDFFGARVRLAMIGERIFSPALTGKKAQVLGNPDLLHTQTYMKDIGKSLVVLSENDDAFGQVWHLPNPETVTTREFIEKVFRETGHKVRIQAASKTMIKLMGLFNPQLREMVEMFYQFEEPFVVDDSKFKKAFGDVATPLDQAIRETVEWYRAHPNA